MKNIWNELRLLLAYWLLARVMDICPKEHPEGRKLLTSLAYSIKMHLSGRFAP